MVAPTPEFTPVQCYIIPGTNDRLYVSLNILNVDLQSNTFHATIRAYTLTGAMQTLFDVQEQQGKLQAAPAPLQALADGIMDGAAQNGVGSSPLDVPMNGAVTGSAAPDEFVQLTPEQLDQAAAGLKKVMEEFTNGLQGHATAGKYPGVADGENATPRVDK